MALIPAQNARTELRAAGVARRRRTARRKRLRPGDVGHRSSSTLVSVGWPTLLTERLVLRPLALDDLDELAALHAQESFWRYPFGRGWSRDETQSFLERTIQRYQDPGIAVSAVVLRDSHELAGWAGLSIPTFLPEILPAVEVGWRFGEQYRGQGFATEAGAAWVRHGFEQLELGSIVSIYEPANEASGAVTRRLGFSLSQETTHPVHGVPLHVMSLDREAWSPG